jgi:chromosome segregation ATPase
LESLAEHAAEIEQQLQAHQASLSSADERSAKLDRLATEQERRIDGLTRELAGAREEAGARAGEMADARDREQSLQAMLERAREDLLRARELVAPVQAQALELADRVAALTATLGASGTTGA